MAELRTPDGLVRHVLQETGTVIGRLATCDLVVKEATASRKHARVWWERGRWWVEDLHSTAGTKVDGDKIERHALSDGEVVSIGSLALAFWDPRGTPIPAGPRERATGAPAPPRHLLAERAVSDIELLRTMRQDLDAGAPPLLALVVLAQRLREATSPDAVARATLDAALRVTGADRGLLVRAVAGAPKVEATLSKKAGQPAVSAVPSLVERATRLRVALMGAADTAEGPAAAASVAGQGMRGVLCAPLWDGERVVGHLTLDRQRDGFRDEDLDLAVVLGNQAALEMQRLDRLGAGRRGGSALDRFLSQEVIRRVERDAPVAGGVEVALAARERPITVVHADLLGLDDLVERVPPGQLARLVDAHVGAMLDVAVDRCMGTLDRLDSAALRVIFGAPASNGEREDARAAVRAAIAMAQASEAARLKQTLLSRVRLRIGVHTASAVTGLFGPTKRATFTAMGPAVELAGRIAAAGKPGRVLLSNATYETLRGGFECHVSEVDVEGVERGTWWAARETR